MGVDRGTRSTAETPFLGSLFSKLDDSGVRYCVLRNYDTLPDSLGGSDLDILVDEHHGDSLRLLWRAASREHGGRCIGALGRPASKMCVCGRTAQWWGAEMDAFVGDLKFSVYPFMKGEFVLRRAVKRNGVMVAAERDAAVITALKESLNNRECPREHLERAREAYYNDRRAYLCEFRECLGGHVSRLWDALLMGGNGTRVDDVARATISHLRRTSGLVSWIKEKAQKLLRYRRVVSRPGYSVAVLGTDGSGKSTVIEGVSAVLGQALHNSVYCEHMRPHLLPSLARLFGKSVMPGPVTDPHAGKPSGPLGSLVRLSYYSLDYILGYWLVVFPAMVRRPSLFLFDRYFYDYYIDPCRTKVKLPKWLITLYGVLIPSPDLILCLGADPEVIHRRKPELPIKETHRQIVELKRFQHRSRRAVWIDTSCSIEESVDKALEAITAKMAAKYE